MTTEEATAYVEQAAFGMELFISPEYLPNVVDNWLKIEEIAASFREFPLSENIEAAPVFEP